ncbi:MAG: ROK family protein [Anaerolineales bacterium]
MTTTILPAKPAIFPVLDDHFQPAVLAHQAFNQAVSGIAEPLVIGLERDAGRISRYETSVFPEDHPQASANLPIVERILKFLLWQRGGYRIYVGGPPSIGTYLAKLYAPAGARRFDRQFMSEQVYGQPFAVIPCSPGEVPPANESGKSLGRHFEGCRIGFDLGASDRKVSAVIDGRVVYSEEVIWEPRSHADPAYHYQEIMAALHAAAAHMPRVDAIGGSSAGIYIDDQPMVASLFRSVPAERYHEVRDLFLRIRREMGIPLEVINDGDVTALAGSISLNDTGILGIAMGSSEAAGYVDQAGHLKGWLNELAFAPVDYSAEAPVDEWSNDIGCGSTYFSQQCIFRLAPRAGIHIPTGITDAERLEVVQEHLARGLPGARDIWQSMGIYLGYTIPHYAEFYDFKHLLILGRCTSGQGGKLILEEANRVLHTEFPELAQRIDIQLPDEKSRRVGQAVAAASLPEI